MFCGLRVRVGVGNYDLLEGEACGNESQTVLGAPGVGVHHYYLTHYHIIETRAVSTYSD